MKNYRMYLIGKKSRDMTAETAAKIAKTWDSDVARIVVDGEVFATHQICSIERIRGGELKDLCDINGVTVKDAPRIEDYLSNKKLLS